MFNPRKELTVLAAVLSDKAGVTIKEGDHWYCDVGSKTIYYPYGSWLTMADFGLIIHESAHIRYSGETIKEDFYNKIKDLGKVIEPFMHLINAFEDCRIEKLIKKKFKGAGMYLEELNYEGYLRVFEQFRSIAVSKWYHYGEEAEFKSFVKERAYVCPSAYWVLYFNLGQEHADSLLQFFPERVNELIEASRELITTEFPLVETEADLLSFLDKVLPFFLPLIKDETKEEREEKKKEEEKEAEKKVDSLLEKLRAAIKKALAQLLKDTAKKSGEKEGKKIDKKGSGDKSGKEEKINIGEEDEEGEKVGKKEGGEKEDGGKEGEKKEDGSLKEIVRDKMITGFDGKKDKEGKDSGGLTVNGDGIKWDKKKMESVFGFCQTGHEISTEELSKEVNKHIAKVRKSVSFLKDSERTRYAGGYESGKIENRKLWKLTSLKKTKIFSRKIEFADDNKDMAVAIVVDISGSMNHGSEIWDGDEKSRIHQALVSTTLLTKALEMSGRPVAVWSFNKYYTNHKTWNKKMDYKEMIEIKNLFIRGHGTSDNNDGYAVSMASRELAKRSEKNKVLLVLSDGLPAPTRSTSPEGRSYEDYVLGEEVKKAEKIAKVFSIGIQNNAVARFYNRYTVIESLEELAPAMVKFFKENVGIRPRSSNKEIKKH